MIILNIYSEANDNDMIMMHGNEVTLMKRTLNQGCYGYHELPFPSAANIAPYNKDRQYEFRMGIKNENEGISISPY